MQARSHGTSSAALPSRLAADNAQAGRVIVIVGAGFCGTAVAIHLLRQAAATARSAALRIVLIDPHEDIGAGVAYATRDYPYPLNVAAGQMSLDAANPGDFLDFVRDQGIHAQAGDYLPRQVYGDYLRRRFAQARAGASVNVECIHHRATVLQRGGGRWSLWLDDGSSLRADDVVLALGNPSPACLPELARVAHSERYVRDPWGVGPGVHQDIGSVLLVGSGLTMIDAALRLAAIRPRVRHIHVLSRHGRLPQAQNSSALPPKNPDVAGALAGARGSTRQLFQAFRRLMRNVNEAGGDWREVLALARSQLPSQWQALDLEQRARFLRHVRAMWDVHRHRVPVGQLGAVRALERTGVLTVHAGRIVEVSGVEDAVEVIWRPRGANRTRAWLVDLVINCTGPESRADRHTDPLVQGLLAGGLIRRDALSLGLDIADDGRPVSRDGQPVDRLYYLGPWLRSRDWEATAVPELRELASRLAARLCEDMRAPGSTTTS